MAEQYKTAWIVPNAIEIRKKHGTEVVKIGTRKVQKRKGVFSSEMAEVEEDIFEERDVWERTGKYSDKQIDIVDLAHVIAHLGRPSDEV